MRASTQLNSTLLFFNLTLIYFNHTAEVSPRWFADLRKSTVNRGRRDNGDYFSQITAPNEDVVKVSFKTKEEFQKWGLVVVESIKSDNELRQLQVIEPMQRQMEE